MLTPHASTPVPFAQPIYVTRPMLPPLSEYTALLQEVWDSGWLANGGEQHRALEAELVQWLRVPHLSLFNNGTIALVVACQALRLAGEVITTPFTFPATPHVLRWNNITPVFADIDPETLCIDPAGVESRVTPSTTGILGVHVYGVPCDVHALDGIARSHGLRVVYDGAHAFGTQIDGQTIASFGDATMLSFHATKLFHTAEGGALAVNDPELKQRIDLLKNFGIKNEEEVVMPGINGKMSEINAAFGMLQLQHVDEALAKRQSIDAAYRQALKGVSGIRCLQSAGEQVANYSYFPILVEADYPLSRDALYQKLVAKSYANGEAMHMAATLEIDAVIDPAETRAWLARGLASARVGALGPRFIDTW